MKLFVGVTNDEWFRYALHGRPLEVLPKREESRPAREFLEWHQAIFKG